MVRPAMDFGIGFFATDEAIDPATLGRLVEERGFESLWLAEHTHIPASRVSPWRAGRERRASTGIRWIRSWR